jgi:hypothetical protein
LIDFPDFDYSQPFSLSKKLNAMQEKRHPQIAPITQKNSERQFALAS